MRNISAGFLVGTALAAALMGAISFTSAWAGAAAGQAVVTVGDDALKVVRFSAESIDQEKGTATGQIDFHDPRPSVDQDVDGTGDEKLADAPDGIKLEADVDCLVVVENRAIIGGLVTSASTRRYVGMWVLLYVEDWGGGKEADKISWGFYPQESDTGCGSFPVAAYDEAVEIESGDLQVKQ